MSVVPLKFIVNDEDLESTGLTAIDVAKRYCKYKNSFSESEISGVRYKFDENVDETKNEITTLKSALYDLCSAINDQIAIRKQGGMLSMRVHSAYRCAKNCIA
jgi:hypothetical protein